MSGMRNLIMSLSLAIFMFAASCAAGKRNAGVESSPTVYQKTFQESQFAELSQRLNEIAAQNDQEWCRTIQIFKLQPDRTEFRVDLAPLLNEGREHSLNTIPESIPQTIPTSWVFVFGEFGSECTVKVDSAEEVNQLPSSLEPTINFLAHFLAEGRVNS